MQAVSLAPLGRCAAHRVVKIRELAYIGYCTTRVLKAAFHDTDILARILVDTSEVMRDFLRLFLKAERGSRPTRRHRPILATILAGMSMSVSWNAALISRPFVYGMSVSVSLSLA